MEKVSQAEAQRKAQEELERKYLECLEKIHYSDRYSDDEYEYRHVILPKQLLKMIPPEFFNPDKSGTLNLLTEKDWRRLGITQSCGWVHYEVHAPEPHVLLFRRQKDFERLNRVGEFSRKHQKEFAEEYQDFLPEEDLNRKPHPVEKFGRRPRRP